MSGRRTDVLDLRELIRHLQAGESDRQTAEALHLTRKTVGKYRAWARQHDLLKKSALPTPEELARLLEQARATSASLRVPSSVEPYRAVVSDLRQRGVEMATIFQRLRDEHGYRGSYASVHRFVRSLEPPHR